MIYLLSIIAGDDINNAKCHFCISKRLGMSNLKWIIQQYLSAVFYREDLQAVEFD